MRDNHSASTNIDDYLEHSRSATVDKLLEKSSSDDLINCTEHSEENLRSGICTRCVPTTGLVEEFKQTWLLGWPLLIINTCNMAMQPITSMVVGKLGKEELDAVALASTLVGIIGWSTIIGFGTVCSTLFSQTFGSKNLKLMGIQLQRCLILHLLLVTLLVPIFFNLGYILQHTGQDPVVAKLAGEYLIIFTPGLISIGIYFVLREYIYAQNVIFPDLFIAVTGFLIHIPLQYVLVYTLDLGITGSAIGQVCAK